MHIVALIWGILAVAGMLLGFIPCVGWFNYLNIPFAVVGLIIGLVALSKATPATRSMALWGTLLCGGATVFGVIRLYLGGGLL